MTDTITVVQEKSRQIASGFANMKAIVDDIQTQDDARQALHDLKTLEDLLVTLDEFNKQIAKYVSLEIETYRRINELGLSCSLKKESQQRIAAWIGEQTEADLDALVRQLKARPQTIETFFTNRIRPGQKYDEAAEVCDERRKSALAAYKEDESVNLDHYFEPDGRASEAVRSVYDAMKRKTRSELLKRGAVCCGERLYVNPNPKTNDGKKQLQVCLVIRADEIVADLKSFMQLSDMSGSTDGQNECMSLVSRIVKDYGEELSGLKVPKNRRWQP